MYIRLLVACLLALAGCVSAHAAEQAAAKQTAEKPASHGWQSLFDGKTLEGWRASEAPGSFNVRDGAIVVRGPRSHLFYVGPVERHDFRDFELQLEVMTKPGANSGVYFHTAWQDESWPAKGYEVQVNNSQSDPKRTGGLYAVKDNYRAPAKDDVWFTLRIRVEGHRVRTFVDDKLIVDYTQPEQPERPADMQGRVLSSGTFALQAHDPDSEVHYRNIKVRVLP
jgi:opacity protein-like surface antigen